MKKKIRILLFTRYSRLGASSRLRSFQFLPELQKEFDIDTFPLFDDEYLEKLYSGKHFKTYYILRRYIHRFKQLLNIKRYDLIWIEKELFPYLPHWAESWLYIIKKPYVVDYDDAIFHNYDLSSSPLKKVLSRKIDKIMSKASLVIVGNGYLADRARNAGTKHLERIPTVIDLRRYTVKNDHSNNDLAVGWIGSPTTVKYLYALSPVLIELSQRYDFTLRVIGAEILVKNVNVISVCWSEKSEVAEIQKFDIGIMPLTDSPWEKGKCGYKLIQYMACGVPVIASPVGINSEIITDAQSGFLANSDEDWLLSFDRLFSNAAQRKEMGRNGRVAVQQKYSTQVVTPRLARLLSEAVLIGK